MDAAAAMIIFSMYIDTFKCYRKIVSIEGRVVCTVRNTFCVVCLYIKVTNNEIRNGTERWGRRQSSRYITLTKPQMVKQTTDTR